ncbi:MAG: hypothetical protein AAGD25_19270 [Cyanobacteria bacterium P01_F01_bin.150]
MDEFDLFQALYPSRNKVTHGIAAPIDSNELHQAVGVAHSLLNQWQGDAD